MPGKKKEVKKELTAEERAAYEAKQKKRQFRKFSFRGCTLEELTTLSMDEMSGKYTCRARRKLTRTLDKQHKGFIRKVKKSMMNLPPQTKPKLVKTHLRDMLIMPNMVNAQVGIYNGKLFNEVEIKGDMIGTYLGEYSFSYKPVHHGRPGIGGTKSSRFIPLK